MADNRVQLCKCTSCKEVYIDTIGNDKCLRMHKKELPKRIVELTELGCPICQTWDNLADVYDLLELPFINVEEAKEKAPKDAIFLKAGNWACTELHRGPKGLKYYLFVQ